MAEEKELRAVGVEGFRQQLRAHLEAKVPLRVERRGRTCALVLPYEGCPYWDPHPKGARKRALRRAFEDAISALPD